MNDVNDVSEINLLPRPRHLKQMPGFFVETSEPQFAVDLSIAKQGYSLSISSGGIQIESSDHAGAFYATQTLKQLRRQFGERLPCVEISDWPDFPMRGVMLDISRDKVPTMATLFSLIDRLAEWKINQLQLYMEHTFAYSQHRVVWKDASPITADEVRELDACCKERFIELVPNQNSFGHMERWLKHSEYTHLAEAIDGAETPWGFRWKGPFSICPTDPDSLNLLRGLYAELLPNFSSRYFNVGFDETFDIGQGRSKARCDEVGVTRVYLDFLNAVNDVVQENGRTIMFWGDIILHKPEAIADLPKNVIAMNWGYEFDHPFDKEGELFAKAGVPYVVCPGTSSWNSIGGRTDNALENLKSAAIAGLKHGAIGYLITDWGDNGHLQYLSVSYLPFAAGAAMSWCLSANENLDWKSAVSLHAFDDASGVMGKIAYDLGNVYKCFETINRNGSVLFRVLKYMRLELPESLKFTFAEVWKAQLELMEVLLLMLRQDTSGTVSVVQREFMNAIQMLQYCGDIAWAKIDSRKKVSDSKKIIDEHRALWLARNRTGGLEDSCSRLLGLNFV